MTIKERLRLLRNSMKETNIDMYIVPTDDFHQSENTGDYFKSREWITGFTGSAGTAVITEKEAGLWTDGRYFLAGAKELEGSTIELRKMGEPGVPTIIEYIRQTLPKNGVLGFDGRTVSMQDGTQFEQVVAENSGVIKYDIDLIDSIWLDRPKMSKAAAYSLDINYTGESVISKLTRLREEMTAFGATQHVMTALDDICWLLNMRGDDIAFSPLVLSYAVIGMENVELFIDKNKLTDDMIRDFEKNHVRLHPYNHIYAYVRELNTHTVLLLDSSRINYALLKTIPNEVDIVDEENPTVLFKSIKNETEIDNIKKAQLKDSIAHTKYMFWLKTSIGKMDITELSATDKLTSLRKEQGGFIDQSFDPITAFGEHAAIVHYSSSNETNTALEKGNFLLSDTGANFYEGSTDITRTFAIGDVPDEMKKHYTLTLKSHLNLDKATFLYGVNGTNLDILARQPFWNHQLNYNHGTGHGVGYLLNIHESPIGIRWQYRQGESHPFENGMIVTNEPGVYIANSHGIRLENELLVRKGLKNEYGQFMYFETLTFVPFDLDAIDENMLSSEDKQWLNTYHQHVFEKIAPYLTDDEANWLEKYTRCI